MSAIHWSIVLAKIDLVSLYFRLLWYHSILKGSIDQYNKIHSPLACSHWLPWFPDLSRAYVACVKHGSGETYVWSLRSESAVKSIPRQSHVGQRNIQISPPPGDQDWSNALPQGQQRQSNPHPMPSFTDQIRWKLNALCMYEVSVFLYRMAGFTPTKPHYEWAEGWNQGRN